MSTVEPWRDDVQGVLFIGDPHLASRNPGFRRDDYPRVLLDKLRWCLGEAREQGLLAVLLGDLFHWPRENANWLLVALMDLLAAQPVLAIPGNHDCHEDELTEHDSLMVLARAGRLTLIDRDGPWLGAVRGHPLVLGGTAWGQPLPEEVAPPRYTPAPEREPTVVWITHHDVVFSGPEIPRYVIPRPIPGVDLVVNGHIHCREPVLVRGETTWLNPGNIARVSRDEVIRAHRPAALRLDLDGPRRWRTTFIEVPHQPFEEVFYDEVLAAAEAEPDDGSPFVRGLKELAARRTDSGAGLVYFLEKNLPGVAPPVAAAIRGLALEVLPDEHPWNRRAAGHSDAQAPLRGAEQEEDPGRDGEGHQ